MNNYEKIKQMTVDEMVQLLIEAPLLSCEECPYKENCIDLDIDCPTVTEAHLKNWLLQEVDNEYITKN